MIQALLSYFYCICVALTLFTMAACTKSCSAQRELTTESQPAAPLASLKDTGLDVSPLSTEQAASFSKFLNDEICPCGCPTSFAGCLAHNNSCPPGLLLAQWALGHIKAGIPERALYQALSDEINNGFLSIPLTVNTEHAHHKGNKDAALTVIEFADFECPACKIAAKSIAKVMKEHSADIQLYFIHLPLNTHPHAEAAAVAAEAAARQGKFWEMHDALFAYEGPLSDNVIHNAAVNLFNPKELAQFEKDRLDPALLAKVRAQKEYATQELKLTGTPTFLFNGRPYNLSLAEDGFLLRLAMEKARSHIKCSHNK